MDEMGESFFAVGAWICLRPWFMALVGVALILMAWGHFKRSRWHLRPIAGGLILVVGLFWLAAAALEEHCRRWSEANISSVPIRIDLVLIPPIILPAAVAAIIIWALAFKAKREKRSQQICSTVPEGAATQPTSVR